MKKGISRRHMLRLTATAGLGTILLPEQVYARTAAPLQENDFQIPLRTLGRTGMQLPILSMGVNRADNANVLRAASNSGILHFDCGHIYQNGKSEEMIGNVLGNRPRESVNLATKAMYDYPLRDNFEEILLGQLEVSLKRMKTDYVDIFYAHSVSSVEKLSDPRVLAVLQQIKESGKARFVGFSSHDQNNDLLRAAIDLGVYDVAMITYNFRIDNLEETEAVIEQAARAGMGIIAMKVMAGGTEDADGKKKIDGRACLKWVWQNPNITTVLPSVANYDELDSCLDAVRERELTDAEQEYLATVHDREALFCRQCGHCSRTCAKQLPLPDLMRAYMYTYRYRYARLGKETMKQVNIPENPCGDCSACSVSCPLGYRVSDYVAAITPLITVPDEFLS